MFGWVKRLWPFGKKQEFSEQRWQEYQEAKERALERILGPMDETVGHAIIPFFAGGTVDMYYFSQHLPGTVFATMELIGPDGKGPKRNRMGTYELVTCTRLQRPTADLSITVDLKSKGEPFDTIERRSCGTMTSIARHSFQAVLQPGHTCEIPGDEEEERVCILFDEFDTKGVPFEIQGRNHGLLLCMEVHPSELSYAREHGSQTLLTKLKGAGVYPYSDLDRDPVV